MDAVQYLAQIEKRWRTVARVRALIDPTLFLMICLVILVALAHWSIIDRTLWIASTPIIIFLVALFLWRSLRYHRLPPKKIELFVDETLNARGRIISIAELRTEHSGTYPPGLSEFIEKQLSRLAEPPHPSELVPWNFNKKEILKVTIAILCLIVSLAIIFGSPKSETAPLGNIPPQQSFDEIAKKLEETATDPNLPKAVQEALTETAQLIRNSETTQGQLQESVARGERAIQSAQKTLGNTRTNKGMMGVSTPESSPESMASPTPTESPKDDQTSTQSEQKNEEQERSQENPGGNEGDPSEPKDSGEPRDGAEKGEEQEAGAEGGEQGDEETDKKSQKEGTGAGETPKDSQKGGQGNDPESEQSGEQGGGKDKPSDTGAASDDASKREGEDSKQQQALNQASDALQKAKEMSEPSESQQQSPPNQEQQGETPSEQGEKSKQQGPSSDTEQQEKDAAPPQSEEGAQQASDADSNKKGESEAKQKNSQDKGDEQGPDSNSKGEKSNNEQKQGDSSPAGSTSETEPEDKEGDSQDKPATKSSLPQNEQESREFKEGDDKEWNGPDAPASFKDTVIEGKGEVYDERFTGAESGTIRADGKPSGLGAIVPRPLGRPDSILDSSKQRVPLEYKDVID